MSRLDDDREHLAAEWVLGTLDGPAAAEAERLAASDTAFREAAETWRVRLLALDDTADRIPPPAALWSKIDESIDPEASSGAEASMPVVAVQVPAMHAAATAAAIAAAVEEEDAPAPAPASALPPDRPRHVASAPPVRRRRRAWRTAWTRAAAAVLVVVAGGLGFLAGQRERTPQAVAVLLTPDNRPSAVVNVFADGRTELVPLTTIDVPEGRALQVWTLWDQQRGPVSVGLIDQARSIRLDLSSLPRAERDQIYEITLEPASGSPTGRPTGPVLMKGTALTTL